MRGPRRVEACALVVVLLVIPAIVRVQRRTEVRRPQQREWQVVGGTAANARYSPLDQINSSNVGNLGGAWMTRVSGTLRQATDLAVGVMYRMLSLFLGASWHPRSICFTPACHRRCFRRRFRLKHQGANDPNGLTT